MTLFSIYDGVFKNWFLIYELHTSRMIQSITSPIVILQGISLEHISSHL